jgi:hypothetical protein
MSGLDALLAGHPPRVVQTMRELCRFVQEVVSGADMEVGDDAVRFALARRFCTLAPARDHVTLTFTEGAELEDPEGLLQVHGDARLMHVRSFGDLDHERTVRWLNQAEAKAK